MLFGFRLLCLHCRRSFLINRPISPFCWWTLLRKLLTEGGFMWCTFSFRSKAGIQRVNVNSKVNEVFCWYVYIGGIQRASEYRHSKLRSRNSDISCVFIEPGFYDAEGRYNLLRHASCVSDRESWIPQKRKHAIGFRVNYTVRTPCCSLNAFAQPSC